MVSYIITESNLCRKKGENSTNTISCSLLRNTNKSPSILLNTLIQLAVTVCQSVDTPANDRIILPGLFLVVLGSGYRGLTASLSTDLMHLSTLTDWSTYAQHI